jgi:hypothetical protein
MEKSSDTRSAKRSRWVIFVLVLVACVNAESATSSSASGAAGVTALPTTTPSLPPTAGSTAATTEAPVTTTAGDTGMTGTTGALGKTTSTTSLPGPGVIQDPTGFSMSYPEGWHEAEETLATQYSDGAQCVSALIVDDDPSSDTAQAGFLLQSLVQICAKPLGGQSLDEFMDSVYGADKGGFVNSELGGLPAYRFDEELQVLMFVQSDSYRFQVVGSVAAEPDLEAQRLEEVRQILDSVDFS